MKICTLCGEETKKLYSCSYCQKRICKECTRKSEVGLVCKVCDEETARQINWEGWELNLEEVEG